MSEEEKPDTRISIWSIQDHSDPYWTQNLRGMLGMIDQIMRFDGRDEEQFKPYIWLTRHTGDVGSR